MCDCVQRKEKAGKSVKQDDAARFPELNVILNGFFRTIKAQGNVCMNQVRYREKKMQPIKYDDRNSGSTGAGTTAL